MANSAPPRKPKNQEVRSREHLTPDEVEALVQAAKKSERHGHRNATLILMMYRHGLRVSEAIALRWDQVDLKQGTLYVNRMKRGIPSTHPLRGVELRSLRRLRRDYPDAPYLFQSERKGPMSDRTARHIIATAGELANLPFPVHPHMLRHATGYYLALNGQDTRAIQAYLGHRNIQHTVRYTELAPGRFKDFWQD
jgi:site-specific recombinase XerD